MKSLIESRKFISFLILLICVFSNLESANAAEIKQVEKSIPFEFGTLKVKVFGENGSAINVGSTAGIIANFEINQIIPRFKDVVENSNGKCAVKRLTEPFDGVNWQQMETEWGMRDGYLFSYQIIIVIRQKRTEIGRIYMSMGYSFISGFYTNNKIQVYDTNDWKDSNRVFFSDNKLQMIEPIWFDYLREGDLNFDASLTVQQYQESLSKRLCPGGYSPSEDIYLKNSTNNSMLLVTPKEIKTIEPRTSSIICAKGKLTKKVTGVNPKCPTGYKKK